MYKDKKKERKIVTNAPRILNMLHANFYSLFAYCGKPIPEIDQTRLPFDQLDVD